MRHVFDGAKLFISNTRCRLRPDVWTSLRALGRRQQRVFEINNFAPSKTWRILPWKGLFILQLVPLQAPKHRPIIGPHPDNGYKSVFTNLWLERQRNRSWIKGLGKKSTKIHKNPQKSELIHCPVKNMAHITVKGFIHFTTSTVASSEAPADYRPAPDNGYKSVFTNLWLERQRNRSWIKGLGKNPQKSPKIHKRVNSFIDGSAFCPGAPKHVSSDSEKHLRVYTSSHKCHSHVWCVDTATGKTLADRRLKKKLRV